MQQIKPASRNATRVTGAAIVCLLFASPTWCDGDKELKNAAKTVAQEIERTQLHKLYVADFLDPLGTRTDKGCFFASSFSTSLAKDARNFEVINRIHAQKQLNELQVSPQDFQKPETLSKAAQAVGADAVLVGTVTITQSNADLFLSLRDAASGREIHSLDYHEKIKPILESNFPAIEAVDSHAYYFPGLDGVTQPKCKHCPNPDYTDEARRNSTSGNVLLSVSLDERGMVTSARVVTNPDDSLTKKAVDILKKWRMEPGHDPDGKPVPVRVMIEFTFRMLN